MAKDPAFLFYPGDYLRDTQCLSEKTQVAYDRIMCEHMRKICEDVSLIAVSQEKLDFFTKRLNDDEKSELAHVLTKIDSGFQIEWVAESICKRKCYSNSRAENRSKENKSHMKTYDAHMEIAIVNEYKDVNVLKGGMGEKWNIRPGEEEMGLELTKVKEGAVIEMFKFSKNHDLTKDEIKLMWNIFKSQNFTGEKFYKSKNEVYSHFINWSKTQTVNGKSNSNQQKANGSNYKTAGQSVYADRLKEQLSTLNR